MTQATVLAHEGGVGPQAVHMKLNIKNFGPIRRGTVDLKPLTILVGPNGCGKSHVATLIHSIAVAESDYDVSGPVDVDILQPRTQKALIGAEAERILDHYARGNVPIVSSDIYDIILNFRMDKFKTMLKRNFSREYSDLIKAGENHFDLDISSRLIQANIKYSNNEFDMSKILKNLKIEFSENTGGQAGDLDPVPSLADNVLTMTIPRFCDKAFVASALVDALKTFGICSEKAGSSIYFPTGRIGLTLANKSIILNYYRHMGALDAYFPESDLQGTNIDFLIMLIRMSYGKGYFADHAAAFEQSFEGKIVIDRSHKLPHIEFEQNGTKIPLQVAQSSVQDLAVFLLYLKHMSKQNDLLILEEPEISLHPRMQIRLARLIAQLVNGGLRVLVSTHSPYFMEKLGHCVLASTSKNSADSQFPTDERLRVSDVAAYGFVRNGDGYDIKLLTVDENGIDQSEFVDMFSELYTELVALNFEEE